MRRASIAKSYVPLAITFLWLSVVLNLAAVETVSLSTAEMPPIASVDVRYQSYSVEMAR